jgi:hypothetical protein
LTGEKHSPNFKFMNKLADNYIQERSNFERTSSNLHALHFCILH